jgi:hypothetical protein
MEPTQKTSVEEWINIYEGAKSNPIKISYTTNDFEPKIKFMHKRVVIPIEVSLYVPRTLQLLSHSTKFWGVFKSFKVCTIMGFRGLTLNLFHEDIESLTFDPRYWGWNGQIKMVDLMLN